MLEIIGRDTSEVEQVRSSLLILLVGATRRVRLLRCLALPSNDFLSPDMFPWKFARPWSTLLPAGALLLLPSTPAEASRQSTHQVKIARHDMLRWPFETDVVTADTPFDEVLRALLVPPWLTVLFFLSVSNDAVGSSVSR